MMLALCYRTASSLITRQPAVMVDHDGVTCGNERLTWPEIASIRRPRFPPWVVVSISPTKIPAPAPSTSHATTCDTRPQSPRWLDSLLDRHRAEADESRG